MPTQNGSSTSGWIGWIFFAAIMMIVEGGFQIIQGLVAIFNKAFYATSGHGTVVFNVTAWGWISLAVGLVTITAGLALFSGALWARLVAITLAALSLFGSMAFLPAYPVWSVIIGLVDILVIYAIVVHGEELKA